MKKIIFPFYNKDRHKFLAEKWWFRAIIVIYVIGFIITPFAIWFWHVKESSGWCYNSLYIYYDDKPAFDAQLADCTRFAREAWINGIPIAILGWLIIHYLIQIIFFKIIVNYIVLGRKK
ncbi:MAG: hypothetical protein WC460_02460 [Patescibacteria group bacterium]